MPLDSLAGHLFASPPDAQELDALLDRIARGQARADRLILDNGDEVAGLIETLEADKLTIKGDLGPVDIALRRIVAVIFNPALRQQPAARPGAAWIGLADGTRLLAAKMLLHGDSLELTDSCRRQRGRPRPRTSCFSCRRPIAPSFSPTSARTNTASCPTWK